MTIISAPAGSGKTSLLRAWPASPGQPHRLAVVPVQRDQHDAQQFWLALLSAVRDACAATARAEPPAATPDFNGRAMVNRVLSELAGQRGRLIVIIDDLHELPSPDALAQLTTLLTNLPADVHAVLATRRDLPLRLHQLRLAGGLAEIRAADLRFTERETRQLLDASGIALSEAGVALLHQRTEGGPRACGSRRSRWLITRTRSVSSRSSPGATGRSPSTCSPKCWSASRRTSNPCCCAPPCWIASTANWPTC